MRQKNTSELAAELHQDLTKTGARFLITSPAFDDHNVCWITIEEDRVVLHKKKNGDIDGRPMSLSELLEKLEFDFEAWKKKEAEKKDNAAES
ncbi:MAG: hypothetical protein OXP69_14940 [Spirochaetaceae bacterium]|nr:hypothetical protein [Spirochaetaceae bacterium]